MTSLPWEKILSFTAADLAKLVASAMIIVVVNKIQLVNDRVSGLLIALPLTSLVAMVWMWHAGQSFERLANHAEGTFWFVLPTLPMFLILPWMWRHGWGFWPALAVNCLITVGGGWLTVVLLRRCGIELMPE